MAEGVSDLLVEIRASADKYSADLKRIRSESTTLVNSLKVIGDPLKDAERQSRLTGDAMVKSFRSAEGGVKQLQASARAASVDLDSLLAGGRSDAVVKDVNKLEHSIGDAHGAAIGLEQMFGIHLPRSVTRFLAESDKIGPILAGAFSGVAILGMIQALDQLPALFKKLEGAITGWDDAAKKAFDHQLDQNRQLIQQYHDQEIALIKVREQLGLISSSQSLKEQHDALQKIHDDAQKIVHDAEEEQRIRQGFVDGMKAAPAGATGELPALRDAEELSRALEVNRKILADTQKQMRDLDSEASKLAAHAQDEAKARRIVADVLEEQDAANKKNLTRQQEITKAIEEGRKQVQAQVDFWNNAEDATSKVLTTIKDMNNQPIGAAAGLGVSIAEDIQSGLKKADESLKTMITDFNALAKLGKDYADFWEKELQKIRTAGMISGKDDIAAGLATADRNAKDAIATGKEITKAMEEARKAGQQFIDTFINDISRMFTGMIANGQSFWEAFKNLGKSAIAAIVDTFLSSMIHGFLDPFAKQLGEIMSGTGKDAAGKNLTGAAAAASKAGKYVPEVAIAVAGFAALNAAVGNAAREHKKLALAIGAVGGVAGVAVAGLLILINGLHKLANEFVKNVQNPFDKAVGDLFSGLSDANAMGTLTSDQVKQARFQLDKMWAEFQEQAKAANAVVGAQALATETPFFKEWQSWLDGLDLAAAQLAHMAKVMDFMSKVTDAAKDSEALNEAISNLQQNGASASSIIEFLGGDIESMVAAMKALNMEIPAGISGINDLMNAIERIGEIDTELQNISEELSSAITRKLDILDSSIQELESTLGDAAHWQQKYNDAVKESEDNWKRLTDERASMEKRIAQLTQDIERDKLVKALENAKAVGGVTETLVKTFAGITKGGHAFTAVATSIKNLGNNSAAVNKAQKELDDFDAKVREQQMQANIAELAELQKRLPEVIRQQTEARNVFFDTAAATVEAIAAERAYMTARLEELRKDKEATEALAKSLGIARVDEFTNINNTILALENRAIALIGERTQLEALAGAAGKATESIAALIASLTSTFGAAPAADAGFAQVAPGGFLNYGLPSFDVGGVASRRGLAQVDTGELMIPKGQVGMIVRLLQELVKKDTNIVMDNTKLNRVQNRATQYGGTRSLASEVRR